MREESKTTTKDGVFIHDISIRYGEQVIPLDALDTDEVLAKSRMGLSGSISGKLPSGAYVGLRHDYRAFKMASESTKGIEISRGRFRTDLRLHNGINKLFLRVVDADGAILDEKSFELMYKGSFREWNETIFIAFFLAILIRSLVLQAFWIPTGSMEPTLLGEKKDPFTGKKVRSGDRILVSRFAYEADFSLDGRIPFLPRVWLCSPRRGDIVVFKFPDPNPKNPPKDFIKRCIGLPGDIIKIRDGVVSVNGVALKEPYIAAPPVEDFGPVVVPKDSIFCMGDNRNNSWDSRFWGKMPLKNLKGKAVFAYFPINRIHAIRSHPHPKLEHSAPERYPVVHN